MGEPAAAIECVDEDGNGVRVEFVKQGVRFQHNIYGICGSGKTLLLHSIEGADTDEAPPSPPFTEVHQQQELIFLSGATTAGHWSMSVAPVPFTEELSAELFEQRYGLNRPEQQPRHRRCLIVFDLACRLKKNVERLGCEYQCSDAVPGGSLKQGALTMHRDTDGNPRAILVDAIDNCGTRDCYIVPEGTAPKLSKLCVRPGSYGIDHFPKTVRWRYGIFVP